MLKVFSVFDSKVGAYLPPMIMRSVGEALRAFGNACNHSESDFCKFAEDYTIFEIAEWDELTGTLLPHDSHISLGRAIELSSRHSQHYFVQPAKKSDTDYKPELQKASGT